MKKAAFITLLFLAFGLQNLSAQQKFGGLAPDCKLIGPNAFTPNDDGVNDYFFVSTTGACRIQKFELKIFDRWGRLVFEGDEVSDQWDGSYDGQALKEGVYLWQGTITWATEGNSAGFSETKKGSLVLIR
jgi:gliding motility-associated-like protein